MKLRKHFRFEKEDIAASEISAAEALGVVVFLASVILAFIYFRPEIAAAGLGFINDAVALADSIPIIFTNVLYAIGNGIVGLINDFFSYIGNNATNGAGQVGSGIKNAATAFWNWLSGIFSHLEIRNFNAAGA